MKLLDQTDLNVAPINMYRQISEYIKILLGLVLGRRHSLLCEGCCQLSEDLQLSDHHWFYNLEIQYSAKTVDTTAGYDNFFTVHA